MPLVRSAVSPVTDFISRPSAYIVDFDLRDFAQEEVSMKLTSDGTLSVRAEHEEEKRREEETTTGVKGVRRVTVHLNRSIGSVERDIKVSRVERCCSCERSAKPVG